MSAAAIARLPVVYKRAREALEKCLRVDECKVWRDKAAALASYAKQADDETLFKNAMQIKGRAVRRMGELLKAIETPKGRPEEKPTGGGRLLQTRESIAEATGVSVRQQKDAIAVANIPKRDFEKAIEAERPPTLTQLAKQGTKPAPRPPTDHLNGRSPADFNASIRARGAMRDMAELCQLVTPGTAVRGANHYDLPKMRAWAKTIGAWIERLQKEVGQ